LNQAIPIFDIPEADRQILQSWVRGGNTRQKLARRARIVLLAQSGLGPAEIGRVVSVTRLTAALWRDRYREGGLAALDDRPGRGRPSVLPIEKINTVLVEAARPPLGRTRWSCRTMADHAGLSKSAVQSLWSANDIKPHRLDTFKLSNDSHFEEKFWDVIGLYLNPPDKALVLCCDEKSQCQALERTQPGLPLGIGHIRTQTHDYTRHGTLTLFAALNYLDGRLIHRTEQAHTHREWLLFLKQIDRQTPKGVQLHLIIDNYCTHKEQSVKEWLAKHPRFHIHFTPTSSSWLNLVERFFRDITQDAIREGSFNSVKELADSIIAYMAERNVNPKRYVWKAEGQKILEKIQRARQRLETMASNV
jgi:transposase